MFLRFEKSSKSFYEYWDPDAFKFDQTVHELRRLKLVHKTNKVK